MEQGSLKFLYKLLETPSTSGYEEQIQKVVKNYIKDFASYLKIDLHGNLIVGINTKAPRSVMLSGHCDQIGFMVKYIDKNGFVHIHPVGGIDFGVVPGSRAIIKSKNGIVSGVFGRRAIHLQKPDERQNMKLASEENWIDIGAKDQKEACKLIEVGDPVTFELGVSELKNNLISSPGLDDKVGCFVAIETLKKLAKTKLDVAVYAVSSVQEEVGLRGATTASYSINPEVGIAIDVTHSTDNPGFPSSNKSTDKKLGLGPTISRGLNTNPIVEKMLFKTAKDLKLKVQTDLYPYPGGTDASAMQINRNGVATNSIGIPCRYMHTTNEVVSLYDIEMAVKLLVGFIKNIKKSTDFTPR